LQVVIKINDTDLSLKGRQVPSVFCS